MSANGKNDTAAGTAGCRRQRVLIIEKLTRLTRILARLTGGKYDEMYFIDMAPAYRTDAAVARLAKQGLHWLNYTNFSGAAIGLTVIERAAAAAEEYVDRQLTTGRLFTWLSGFYVSTPALADTYRCYLKGMLQEQLSSTVKVQEFCAAKYPDETAELTIWYATGYYRIPGLAGRLQHVAVPRWWQWLLQARELARATNFVWSSQIEAGQHMVRAIIARWLGYPAEHPDPDPALANCAVIYFPHKHIDYAGHFTKNFIYEPVPGSPLCPRQIAHVFFETTNRVSQKYLGMNGIPYVELNRYKYRHPVVFYRRLAAALRGAMRPMAADRKAGIPWPILEQMARSQATMLRYDDFLGRVPAVTTAVAFFEILFPKLMAVVLKKRNIVTVAAQERGVGTFFTHHFLALDYYLTWGELDRGYAAKAGRARIGQCLPVGPARTDLLDRFSRHPAALEKYRAIKRTQRLVLAFDAHGAADGIEDGFRFAGRHQQGIIFYRALLALARQHPEDYFVIKGKITDHYRYPCYRDIVAELAAQPNLEIEYNLKKYNTYKLTPYADCIIVQINSSIAEEALAAGKPVVFFDTEGVLRHQQHPLFTHGFVAETAAELCRRVGGYLSGQDAGLNSGQRELVRQLYGACDGRVRERLRVRIKNIHYRQLQAS